jgi:uncharacterized protein
MWTGRALRITVASALVTAACHRAPEEPAPQTSLDAAVAPAVSTPSAPAAASGQKAAVNCPRDPEPNAPPLPTATLKISDALSGPLTIEAEVARGDHDTQRGLMYRTQMPEMHGMIFELPREDHAFWMHNTCISLDLLYIDHGQIVGIVESAPTLNDESRRVGKPSDEVLELNAGFCSRHGVNVGQHVSLAGASSPTP